MNRYDDEEMGLDIESMRSDIKYPNIKPPNNINKILEEVSNLEILRKLDPMSVMEYASIVAYYSLYLSGEINKLEAYAKWCESNIKFIIGKRCQDINGYFTEKESYIRAHDELASSLDEKRIKAQTKFETLKFMNQKMQFLSETLQSLAKEKSYTRKINEYN